MKIQSHSFNSPLGEILIGTDASGAVHSLRFASRAWVGGDVPRLAAASESGRARAPIEQALAGYFAGNLSALDHIVLAPTSVPLHGRLRTALRQIGAGSTVTYGDIAQAAGLAGPLGAVEIGAALAGNPVALIVPCHRVIGKRGDLKGFAWHVARKRWLLEHEAAIKLRSFAF